MISRAERDQLVIELRKEGYTFQEIGDRLGLSRERVRQIFHELRRPDPIMKGRKEKRLLSSYDLAKMLRMRPPTVRRRLSRLEVYPLPNTNPPLWRLEDIMGVIDQLKARYCILCGRLVLRKAELCWECQPVDYKARYQRYKEATKAYIKKWRERNRERLRQYSREYYRRKKER